MAETAFTGLTGIIKTGTVLGATTAVAYISGVDLQLDKEIIEVLQFGGTGYKEKVPAIKDFKCTIDGTCAFASTGNQKVLYDAYSNGTQIVIGVYLDSDSYFEGYAYIKSVKISGTPSDKFNLSMELEGSGTLNFTP